MQKTHIEDKTLESYLKSDLRMLGLPTDFTLDFRGYSKTYYGRYYITQKTIVVYILGEDGERLPYEDILDTVLHEALHHYQHHYEEGFVRKKGVMHNLNFKSMYSKYVNRLFQWGVIQSA